VYPGQNASSAPEQLNLSGHIGAILSREAAKEGALGGCSQLAPASKDEFRDKIVKLHGVERFEVDGKTCAVGTGRIVERVTSQRVRHLAQARRVPAPRASFFLRTDVGHFQPSRYSSAAWRIKSAASTSRCCRLPWAKSIRRAHPEQSTYMRRRNALA
jgi:hypothetical protein